MKRRSAALLGWAALLLSAVVYTVFDCMVALILLPPSAVQRLRGTEWGDTYLGRFMEGTL